MADNVALKKQALRSEMRKKRDVFYDKLPHNIRGLVFSAIPNMVMEILEKSKIVGIYHAIGSEAPAQRYAHKLLEKGITPALPYFDDEQSDMAFRIWHGDDRALLPGAFGILQPDKKAEMVKPDALIMPLLGFDDFGNRLGQGGGHYDRYCAENDDAICIGLGWSVQKMDDIPAEKHDKRMNAVITNPAVFSLHKPPMMNCNHYQKSKIAYA